ncbi:unnamed protein product [Calicophoron daubneyi]|uniref:PDZ domain-containing protein n=1 Tax=Calicophoron daubneyi TaxID=300641 RepID=A0AAV2TVA1_CALDB
MTNAPAPLGSHFGENPQTLATRHKPSSQPPSDEPDLSHLTPEERRIIEDVLNRQKQEEIKDAELIKKTSTVVSTTPSRSSVPPTSAQTVPASTSGGTAAVASKQSAAALPHNGGVNNPPKSTSGFAAALTGAFNAVTAEPAFEGLLDNVCQICRKTKFADGLGHACTTCRRKTCTRCGYQMNTDVNQVKWTCKECAQSNPSGQTNPTQSQLLEQTTSGSAVSGQKTAGRFASGLLDLFGGQKPAIPAPDQKQSLHTEKKRQLPQIGSVDRRSAREFDYSAPNLVPPSAGRVMPHLPPSRRLSSAEEYGTISNERYANSEFRDPEQGYYSQQYERPYYGEQFQRSGYQSSPRTARYGRRSGASDRRYPGYPNVNTSRLDPYYYADSLTSDRSESPARSMGGWSSSGYRRPSPAPMAYTGRSDSEYDAERYQYSTQAYPPRSLRPRRYHSPSLVEGGYPEYETDRQEYKFSPIPPSYGMDSSAAPPEFQSPSFSSSEADEVGGIRSDEMVYPEDEVITASTSRKRRNLPDYYSDSPRSAATTFEGEYPSRNAPTIQRPVEEYAYSDPSQLDRKSEHPMSRRFLTPIQAYDSDNLEEFSDQGPVVEEYEGGLSSGDGMPYLNTEQRPRRIPPEIVQSRTSQSATWNPSADGKRLISRMILRKRTDLGLGDGGTILGLKISGGRPTPSGVLGAFITRIKDGSLADVVGQLKPGDEVLEWNGHPLRNLSAEEVSDVLYRTKDALEVELLVQRNRK